MMLLILDQIVMSSEATPSARSQSSSVRVKPRKTQENVGRPRRTRIPDKPQNSSCSLWSTMKGCIGKELTKIPMPVNFNEPLSALQRVTEDLEYSDLLDHAAESTDPFEQLCYVAAFATSCYRCAFYKLKT